MRPVQTLIQGYLRQCDVIVCSYVCVSAPVKCRAGLHHSSQTELIHLAVLKGRGDISYHYRRPDLLLVRWGGVGNKGVSSPTKTEGDIGHNPLTAQQKPQTDAAGDILFFNFKWLHKENHWRLSVDITAASLKHISTAGDQIGNVKFQMTDTTQQVKMLVTDPCPSPAPPPTCTTHTVPSLPHSLTVWCSG